MLKVACLLTVHSLVTTRIGHAIIYAMKAITPLFETSRLVFIQPREEDLLAVGEWIQDAELMRYQDGPWIGKQGDDYLEFIKWHWSQFGFGHFIGISKQDNSVVGLFSLKYLNKDVDLEKDLPDLGCILNRKAWGKGLATEGAKALSYYAFDQLGFKEIGALNHPDNAVSSKVLKKIGFQEIGIIDVVYNGKKLGVASKWKLTPELLRSQES